MIQANDSCGISPNEIKKKRKSSRLKDLTGFRFGKLIVECRVETHGQHAMWLCRCDCGNKIRVTSIGLLHRKPRTKTACDECRPFRGRFLDRTGKRYGKLTVISEEPSIITRAGARLVMWKCKCDCGNEHVTHNVSLIKSCGCLRSKPIYSPKEKSARLKFRRNKARQSDLEKWREYGREKARIRWLNPIHRAKQAARQKAWKKKQKETNVIYRLKEALRQRVRWACKNAVKSGRTMELVGCTIQHLKDHLAAQFVPGMTWKNYGLGGWEIDHRKPCASFDLSDPDQQRECFHWSNLQPLWRSDNARKGAKILDQIAV